MKRIKKSGIIILPRSPAILHRYPNAITKTGSITKYKQIKIGSPISNSLTNVDRNTLEGFLYLASDSS